MRRRRRGIERHGGALPALRRRGRAEAADETAPEEIAAFCIRIGFGALTAEQRARMAELARIVAEAAALPRVADKIEEPMPVFRVRG
ncbi:hypothetical protein SAMN04487779_1001480 [Belnapia rosea]|uniref:Uncharacterized protein n=1 Tax=Belnapia rosea TaxID=938405 RepID=A0A1G6KDI6_9PROT|nr:hypothetical protein SAMN04487779_1001480 [Belnapia rosea]